MLVAEKGTEKCPSCQKGLRDRERVIDGNSWV